MAVTVAVPVAATLRDLCKQSAWLRSRLGERRFVEQGQGLRFPALLVAVAVAVAVAITVAVAVTVTVAVAKAVAVAVALRDLCLCSARLRSGLGARRFFEHFQ